MHEATQRIHRAAAQQRTVISSWSSLLDYVRVTLRRRQARAVPRPVPGHAQRPDPRRDAEPRHGRPRPAYPREIATRAWSSGPRPSSSSTTTRPATRPPSRADIDTTRQIVDACRPLKIAVHDHLVVGREGVASFKALGLI
jgi:DNA repair protein RadC